jgi:TetR/AcrR family transcriptional regulator, regulator of cefoperazone and chloramphenicol sensitivity
MPTEDATSERGRGARTKRPSGEATAKKRFGGGARDVEAPEPSRDSISRQRIIEAAIRCILDVGFYRASSNAIAESAGATWGVIQYHFGTREALMLAVLEEGARRLNETLLTAEITGNTVTERIAQYGDILANYYGSPQYLAYTQVLINLAHDPRTSGQTRATMARFGEWANPELDRLQDEVLAGTGIQRPEIRSLLFHALRGLSISHVMLDTVPDHKDQSQQFPERRRLLAEALGMLIEAQRQPGA